MIEWAKLTNEELADVDRNLPVLIPIGLVEAHGPHLTLGLDNDTAIYFARRLAEATGAVLAPAIHYGFADAMKEYPGTVGVSADTLSRIVRDLSMMFCFHGFRKQIYVSGHGANKAPCELGFYAVWETYPDFKPACWNWWTEAGIAGIHHADKGETEAAMAVGSPVYMDRVRDFAFRKPWHMVHSRYRLQPESGGINGFPSLADPAEGERVRERVVRALSEKVEEAIRDRA
ncbi:creatininase family protein [Paenibacillus hodogayensis]|uniref:Creatininase family protein n=1 Tax=Paenibacillus hodogayensis TaxID=279208 RepID=A0ABV5VYH3_9BACL